MGSSLGKLSGKLSYMVTQTESFSLNTRINNKQGDIFRGKSALIVCSGNRFWDFTDHATVRNRTFNADLITHDGVVTTRTFNYKEYQYWVHITNHQMQCLQEIQTQVQRHQETVRLVLILMYQYLILQMLMTAAYHTQTQIDILWQ